jgi:hypothetical protein
MALEEPALDDRNGLQTGPAKAGHYECHAVVFVVAVAIVLPCGGPLR